MLAAGALGLLCPTAHAKDAAKRRLLSAYPDFLVSTIEGGILWNDGALMGWNAGPADKTFEQKVADASLADQMSLPYAAGPLRVPPPPDFDPGRFRDLAFFKKMYGRSASEVQKNIALVDWHIGNFREAIPMSRINGVDVKLAAVVQELNELPASLRKFLVNPGGGFNWRHVAGTEQLSPHAFGIAIDINVEYSNYWRWEDNLAWKNRIPYEIVAIFERHGFIWGGKWYHFDTMHFEYRPELLS